METVETVIAERTNTPNGYYTSRYSGEEIDRKLDIMVSPNLLDNAYFVGGGTGWGVLPVNQRGQTSYSGTSVGLIDRWLNHVSGGTYDVTSNTYTFVGGTSVFSGMIQRLGEQAPAAGEQFVLSVLMAQCTVPVTLRAVFSGGGTVEKTFQPASALSLFSVSGVVPAGNTMLSIQIIKSLQSAFTGTMSPVAAKLEVGEGQTLAYQDKSGVWNFIPQPDMSYQTQLSQCQPYQIELNIYGLQYPTIGSAVKGTGGWYAVIPLPTTMRLSPAISITNGSFVVECTDGAFSVSNLTLLSFTCNMAIFLLTFSGAAPTSASAGTFYAVGSAAGVNAPSIILDANL